MKKICKTKKPLPADKGFLFSDPAGIRTQDPRLKRPLLYQLSYGINEGAKVDVIY